MEATDDSNEGMNAYCGPVARHILRLEARIEELEARLDSPPKAARIEAGSMAIDTRPGLSVQDVADLIRASK